LQLLNNKQIQIDNIWAIINRDYVENTVKNCLIDIENSEEFTNKRKEMETSKRYLDEIARIELKHRNNLTARQLLLALRKLNIEDINNNNTIKYYTDYWVTNASIEEITNDYESELNNMDSFLTHITFEELKVNSSYTIINQIKLDIKTRLSLTAVSDLDSIVNDMVKYIDINKYLYNK